MIEVLFTPAEFGTLSSRDLSAAVCIVFDVLRATSSMIAALANGAESVVPVAGIPEALTLKKSDPDILLAGERDGLRIPPDLTGGVPFDLGNSPREFIPERVRGKRIAMTTTNGTRALRACAHARTVLVGCFLNLSATAEWIARQQFPYLLLVCSGTYEQAAYEDTLAAGALCDRLWPRFSADDVADSAIIARQIYCSERGDLASGIKRSRNGQRLWANTTLRDDVAFCLRFDAYPCVALLGSDGEVRLEK